MKAFVLSALLLALQDTGAAVAGPIDVRNDKLDTPPVEEIRKEIDGKIPADKALFYTGGKGVGAKAFHYKKKHGMMKLQDLDPQKKKWDNPDLWKDHDLVQKHFSQAMAEISSGTVWVMFTSMDEIDLNRKGTWVKWEWPALTADNNDKVEEIIQVDMNHDDRIEQIWPKEIRKAEGTCQWYGTAPECETKCPDGTTEYAKSKFGDNYDQCAGAGRKRYCCKN